MRAGFFKRSDVRFKPKSAAGLHKRENGVAFETWLERFFAFQESRFGHIVEKTPEPMKVLSSTSGGTFQACFLKRAQPDFKGVLKCDSLKWGLPCVFEAKSTVGKSISFELVKEHQVAALFKYHSAGAVCAIIVALNNRKDFFCIPFSRWCALPKILNKKSANAEDLEPFRFDFDTNLLDIVTYKF